MVSFTNFKAVFSAEFSVILFDLAHGSVAAVSCDPALESLDSPTKMGFPINKLVYCAI